MKVPNQAKECMTNMKNSSDLVKAAELGNNMIKYLTEKDLAGTSTKNGPGRLKSECQEKCLRRCYKRWS